MGGVWVWWLLAIAPLVVHAFPRWDMRKIDVTGKFWHVTDLHVDFSYHLTEDHTKVCLTSKGENASNPGVFGDFLCDSPYQLILSAFQHINKSEQKANFMIWTGDSMPHLPVNDLSTKMVIDMIGNMTTTIRTLLPDLLVYPAFGNHDYWPQDQFPVEGSEVYEAAAEFWKPWLNEEALCTLRKGGYYSQIYSSSPSAQPLRIISLNTNLYYGPNKVTVNMTDPAGQFEWLEDTLHASRQRKEKVYIIAHVPIGFLPYFAFTSAMQKQFNERLVTIFRNYSAVVAGQFYGHIHRDSIMVLLNEKENPVGSVFIAPSVTPIRPYEESGNNPGFRIYHYDSNTYDLLDLWHYYLNLTDANLKGEAIWKLEYIMTEIYKIKDLQPDSMEDLVKRLAKPDSLEFKNYYKNHVVQYELEDCVGRCKVLQVCSVKYIDRDSYFKCAQENL